MPASQSENRTFTARVPLATLYSQQAHPAAEVNLEPPKSSHVNMWLKRLVAVEEKDCLKEAAVL